MFFGYTRVSTADQANDKATSLAEQERVIRGLAMTRGVGGYDVAMYSDPGVSGSVPLSERPAGKELLATMRRGDIVCASKLDRMFRSAIDALQTANQMKDQGVSLILFDMGADPVTGNGVAKFFFTMVSAFAELERDRIHERLISGKTGKKQRLNGMGHVGGIAPYGFRIVGQSRDAVLEPVEAEQEMIRDAMHLSRRHPPSVVCRQLNIKGYRDRAGSELRIVQVKRLVARGKIIAHDARP